MRRPNKSAEGKRGIQARFHTGRSCPALPERCRRPLSTAMKATLFLVFLSVLVGCASAPSSAPKAAARWHSVIAALKLYHEEVHDYPKRLVELHPYYLSADVPLHDEKYPGSLRQIWSTYRRLDPQWAPTYQRLGKDYFVSYRRIDQDNYSLQLFHGGRLVTVANPRR
jgi:hypothetical protein